MSNKREMEHKRELIAKRILKGTNFAIIGCQILIVLIPFRMLSLTILHNIYGLSDVCLLAAFVELVFFVISATNLYRCHHGFRRIVIYSIIGAIAYGTLAYILNRYMSISKTAAFDIAGLVTLPLSIYLTLVLANAYLDLIGSDTAFALRVRPLFLKINIPFTLVSIVIADLANTFFSEMTALKIFGCVCELIKTATYIWFLYKAYSAVKNSGIANMEGYLPINAQREALAKRIRDSMPRNIK